MPVITYMEMNSTISTVQQIKYNEKKKSYYGGGKYYGL